MHCTVWKYKCQWWCSLISLTPFTFLLLPVYLNFSCQLTGDPTLQWFWLPGGFSPELPHSDPRASKKGPVEDAGERPEGVTLRCQAGERMNDD